MAGTLWPLNDLNEAKADNARSLFGEMVAGFKERWTQPTQPEPVAEQPTSLSFTFDAESFMPWLQSPASAAVDVGRSAVQRVTESTGSGNFFDLDALMPWKPTERPQANSGMQSGFTSSGGSPLAMPQGAPAQAGTRAPSAGGSYADVTPDEDVTRESVTRSAAAALTKAGLPAGMAPYLAGIAINEGILQPGTIARDYWSVGGVKADGGSGTVTVPTREVIDGQSVMQNASFGRFNSMQEGMDALARFVKESPRFGPIVQQAAQSGDFGNLITGFKEQGYATDPNWVSQVNSIANGLPVPAARPSPTTPPQAEQTPEAQVQAPVWGTYTPETLTPNQFSEGQAQGLSSAEALAICGPAAAVAFARANGRNPTLREAKELAQNLGLWDASTGMYGPAAQVQLLGKLGVQSTLRQGVDWGAVAREVQAGRPVILDSPLHYYTVTGYDPRTGEFEFGASAGVLTKSGGKTRWRPEDIPSLGMGSIRATIFMGQG